MNPISKRFSLYLVFFTFLGLSCNRNIRGFDYESEIAKRFGIRNEEADTILAKVIPLINSLIKQGGGKTELRLAEDFKYKNQHEVLVIPITPFNNKLSASSNINMRFILLSLDYINSIMYEVMLDPDIMKEIVALILMHEACHFELGEAGLFDELLSESVTANTDIASKDYLTLNLAKRLELKVDSLSAFYIRTGAIGNNISSREFSSSLAENLHILEASVFTDRLTEFYGTAEFDLLTDISETHPNFELRLAFMNYYLNPTEEKRQMIDTFIKTRTLKLKRTPE